MTGGLNGVGYVVQVEGIGLLSKSLTLTKIKKKTNNILLY